MYEGLYGTALLLLGITLARKLAEATDAELPNMGRGVGYIILGVVSLACALSGLALIFIGFSL